MAVVMEDIALKKPSRFKSTVPAVDQAMKILQCLAGASRSQLTLTEICERVGLHKSKGYTILNTLIDYDFIEKDARVKTYRLSLGIVQLARNVIDDLNIQDLLKPYLTNLAQTADATAHYGMISGDRFIIIAKEESRQRFGYTMRIGAQHHLTHGAHGKAIVASLPPDQRESILGSKDLCFYGDGRAVDLDYLNRELASYHKLGYAVDPGETNPNIICLSSAVTNADSVVVGAVLLIGVFQRSQIKTLGPLVAKTARSISAKMI